MDTNNEGLLKVRCINYIISSNKIKICDGYGSYCVKDITIDGERIVICSTPVLVDWVSYLKYKSILKICE